jgi:hypothetical protein
MMTILKIGLGAGSVLFMGHLASISGCFPEFVIACAFIGFLIVCSYFCGNAITNLSKKSPKKEVSK